MYIDPVVIIKVSSVDNPKIYQPLILQCVATIMGSVSSTVDIIWSTGDTQVRRVNNITASSSINSVSVYNDTFVIPSLNVSVVGTVYWCEALINLDIPVKNTTEFTIPIPGIYT